ncbi:Acetolactate synthase small subunit [hydrothermal vent metagenome]|uniref:Acetolactate synthase small subunit n=1 Tax=hydrothermal vent metagenome TaxID=652676 RepID=A0A1W1BUB8_9ZZZZ
MRHIITVQLENEAGALSRVAGLFSARGFNIESLSVAPTNDASLSKLTLVTIGDDAIIEQIVKQLNKLVDVVSVIELTANEHIERELLLLKVKVSQDSLIKILSTYSAKKINETAGITTLEFTDKSKNIERFISEFNLDDIVEVSRTGVTGVIL